VVKQTVFSIPVEKNETVGYEVRIPTPYTFNFMAVEKNETVGYEVRIPTVSISFIISIHASANLFVLKR
jgi:hypothetical protein